MGDPRPLLSIHPHSLLDPSLRLERFSSKQLLEASEALPQDTSWVSFTEQWSTRNASRKKDRNGGLSPVLSGRRRKESALRSTKRERRPLKVAVPGNFEDAIIAYGGQVTTGRKVIMPCLPILNASKPRSHQTSEEQLLNAPSVLNHIRLQPSIRTPGRIRPINPQPPPSSLRFKRKLYLRASNSVSWASQRKNSTDFDPSNGLGIVTGRRFQGSPGRITPL